MHQTALALDVATIAPPHCPDGAAGAERIGFAHSPAGAGPDAPCIGRTAEAPLRLSRHDRQWQELHAQADREGVALDAASLSPAELARIEPTHCPVRRVPLVGGVDADDAPAVVCLSPSDGYRAGSVAVVSRRAAQAMAQSGLAAAQQSARHVESGHAREVLGLDGTEWRRAASLFALAHPPASFAEAARRPLAAIPVGGPAPQHPAHALQAGLTALLGSPGWSVRLRDLSSSIENRRVREDFHLLVGALAPRLLEVPAGAAPSVHRHALEDVWLHPRVQQRWQQLLLSLGMPGTQRLAEATRRSPSPTLRARRGPLDAGSAPFRPLARGRAFAARTLSAGA